MSRGRQRLQPRQCAACQCEARLAARQIDDTHVPPEHALSQPRSQSFRTGLLGSEPLGITCAALRAPVRLCPLGVREDAIEKPCAVALDRGIDAPDIDEIGTDADDHAVFRPSDFARASSIRARMRLIAASSPQKIASPTRKWPIFNSRISGIAAIGPTVTYPSPCPAWISSPREAPYSAASRMSVNWRSLSRASRLAAASHQAPV